MPADSRDFRAAIKSVHVKGETKVNNQGDITAEPEIVVTMSMSMTTANIAALGFLATAKQAGDVRLTVESAQAVMDLGAA